VNLELDDHGGSHDVRIIREQSGDRRLIGTVTVGDDGVGSLLDEPVHNATYEAIALRDATHQRSVSNLERVAVHAVVEGRLGRHYATSGSTRLYHPGVSPSYVVSVQPNATGHDVAVYLEKRGGSGWRFIAKGRSRLRAGSKVLLELNGDLLRRDVLYRVHAVFANSVNAKGVSEWARFKVV
jgi:hypothetical protein